MKTPSLSHFALMVGLNFHSDAQFANYFISRWIYFARATSAAIFKSLVKIVKQSSVFRRCDLSVRSFYEVLLFLNRQVS